MFFNNNVTKKSTKKRKEKEKKKKKELREREAKSLVFSKLIVPGMFSLSLLFFRGLFCGTNVPWNMTW